LAEALDRRRQLQQRVLADARGGRVPGDAVRADVELVDALLADAERVEALAADLDRAAAALVHHEVGVDLVRVLPAQPRRPGGRAGLLVGGEDELEGPAGRAPAVARERDRGRRLRRDL